MAASTITRATWTNDTGSAASPNADGTLITNTRLQNDVYAKIDEMFAGGVGTYATFTLGGKFAVEGFGSHSFSAGGTGANLLRVRNTSAGATNYAAVTVGNNIDGDALTIAHTSSSFSAATFIPQAGAYIQAQYSGGLSIAATNASGAIRFYSGGTSEVGRMFPSGGFSWGDTTDPGAGNFRVAGVVTATAYEDILPTSLSNDLGASGAPWLNAYIGTGTISTVTSTLINISDGLGGIRIGGAGAAGPPTNYLSFKNGTAPIGSVTDGVVLWAEDVAASSELKVRDEAGNVTTLSPHNFSLFNVSDDDRRAGAWSYYSRNDALGIEINADIYGALRAIEALTGKKFIYSRRLA